MTLIIYVNLELSISYKDICNSCSRS